MPGMKKQKMMGGGMMPPPEGGMMPPPENNQEGALPVLPGGGAPAPGAPTNITATADFSQLTGGNGAQILSNGGFNNVTFKYDSTTADGLFNEASGDTINGGFYRGPTDY